MSHPIMWSTKTEYYDEKNGEQITKYNATKNYLILKKVVKIELNTNKTKGFKTIHYVCKKDPQIKINI